eukprot:3058607-Rhodomonas_salina.1
MEAVPAASINGGGVPANGGSASINRCTESIHGNARKGCSASRTGGRSSINGSSINGGSASVNGGSKQTCGGTRGARGGKPRAQLPCPGTTVRFESARGIARHWHQHCRVGNRRRQVAEFTLTWSQKVSTSCSTSWYRRSAGQYRASHIEHDG